MSETEEAGKYALEFQQPVQGPVIGDGNTVHQYFTAPNAAPPGDGGFPLTSEPIWNVPFPRKQFFTGREKLLEQLHTRLRTRRTAALGQVISGLGGIGKTQIAVEYAYRHQQEYQAVLWAHAETTEALTTSYTEIARLLRLPQKDAQEQEDIIQGVKDWLSSQQNWLLILDNADEPDVLIPFLPPQVKGHLIVTTRAADLSNLGLGFGHALIVPKFTKQQDVPFLLRRAGLKRVSAQDRVYARLIANELDGLPLALNQTGVYLATTGSNLITYWRLYRKQRPTLLHTQKDHEYPGSVARTLLLSFGRVEQRNPAAADLLRLCAFLAPDAIPEELLITGAKELGDILAPIADDPYQFDQAFADLRAYSLLTRDPQSRTLTVHRLVQAVLRDSMTIEARQQWKQRVVMVVHAAFSGMEFEDWSTCERLLPHALLCAHWIEQAPLITPEASRLLNQTGYYLFHRGRYGEAEPLLQRALQIREQLLGLEHLDVATSLHNLANLFTYQGIYEQAEPLYHRTLQIRERLLGSEHPDVAATLQGLATLSMFQGKYQQAEPLFQRALQIRERLLGPEHPDIATTLQGLATLYTYQGKYQQAEPRYQQVRQIRERLLGPEHPDVAATLNNLATLYMYLEKYAEAEPLFQQARWIWARQLGVDHPNVAYVLSNLAVLYVEQGRYELAEPLLQRSRQVWEQQDGPEHLGLAYPLSNLATIYMKQGKYELAEPLFQRALQIWERLLGPEHPDVAELLYSLANLSYEQDKHAEAERLYQRALHIRKHVLGFEHPETAKILDDLARLQEAQGNSEEARVGYTHALAVYEQAFGGEHPRTMRARKHLIDLLYAMGRDLEAKKLEEGGVNKSEEQDHKN